MRLLVSLADIRDAFIIAYGVVGIVFFFVAAIITLVVGFAVRGLVRNVREILNDSVKPTLGSIKATADGVRGTTEFVSQTTIGPIIRAYGAFAGMRRALGVITGLARKKRG